MNIKSQYRVIVFALITAVAVFATGCKKETHYTAEEEAAVSGIVTAEPATHSTMDRLSSAVGMGSDDVECGGVPPRHPLTPGPDWIGTERMASMPHNPERSGRFMHKSKPMFSDIPEDPPAMVAVWERFHDMMPCEYRLLGYFPDIQRFHGHDRTYQLNNGESLPYPDWPTEINVGSKFAYNMPLLSEDVYGGQDQLKCLMSQYIDLPCSLLVWGTTLTEHPIILGSPTDNMNRWMVQNCVFTEIPDPHPQGIRYATYRCK